MDKPRAWAKDVSGQCEVETRNDLADDIRAALETAGLHVTSETPVDVRSNVHRFFVTMPDGARIMAANVRALRRGNADVEIMDE